VMTLQPCEPDYLNFHEKDLIALLFKANPALEADHQLYALQNRVDDVAAGGDPLALTFGFAVVQKEAVCFLRIQDHLRRMGLAHSAVKLLVDQRVAGYWRSSSLTAAANMIKAMKLDSVAAAEIVATNQPENLEQFQRIFDSVLRDNAWRVRARAAAKG
jgi:hypothetical protein